MRISTSIFTLALGLSPLACGQDAPTLTATANPTTFASGGSTTLTITATDFDFVMPVPELHRALRVAHDDETGDSETPNSGHYHVYLDDTEVEPILQAYLTTQPVTVTAAAGAHKLIVQLQGEDHKIIKGPIRAEVPITLTP